MIPQVPSEARLEVKFVTRVTELSRIESWLRLHPAVFSQPYPDRWVNNVYFDTYQLSSYDDNLTGSSFRTKLRYRWYGQSELPDIGNLEIKFKRNYFGWKRRFACEKSLFDRCGKWREFQTLLSKELGPEASQWIRSRPNPVLLNRYFRQYFVTENNKVRATIDSKQRVYDQRYKASPNIHQASNIPETLVIEFKFHRKDRDFASSILQGLPIRVSRNSKYVIGVRSMVQ